MDLQTLISDIDFCFKGTLRVSLEYEAWKTLKSAILAQQKLKAEIASRLRDYDEYTSNGQYVLAYHSLQIIRQYCEVCCPEDLLPHKEKANLDKFLKHHNYDSNTGDVSINYYPKTI